MATDVIALPSDSFSSLNQASDGLRPLQRPPQMDGNKFTPGFFILMLFYLRVLLSRLLWFDKKKVFKCKKKLFDVSEVSNM